MDYNRNTSTIHTLVGPCERKLQELSLGITNGWKDGGRVYMMAPQDKLYLERGLSYGTPSLTTGQKSTLHTRFECSSKCISSVLALVSHTCIPPS